MFCDLFWRSHYQPQNWCRFATSELRLDTVGLEKSVQYFPKKHYLVKIWIHISLRTSLARPSLSTTSTSALDYCQFILRWTGWCGNQRDVISTGHVRLCISQEQFHGMVTSRVADVNWLSRLCDLNCLDFFLNCIRMRISHKSQRFKSNSMWFISQSHGQHFT